MIIDFHTHIFPSRMAASVLEKLGREGHMTPFTSGTDLGLKASMDAAGIDLSIILPVATHSNQAAKINAAAFAQNKENEAHGLLSFGGVHPLSDTWREDLDEIVRLGLKGIKIHPVYQGVDLDDPRFLRILERAGELDLIVVSHCGYDLAFPGTVHCSPAIIRSAINQVGPVKFVAAHMGGLKNWEHVIDELADTPVYLDTSTAMGEMSSMKADYFSPEERATLTEEEFLRFVYAFGANRILFASDSPWGDQNRDLNWLRALPLSSKDLSAILGENAKKLLKL